VEGADRPTTRAPTVSRCADYLKIVTARRSPVAYFGEAEVERQLWNVIGNINGNRDYLATLDRDRLKTLIFFMLVSAAVSIKHIGFHEEKEWRVIYLPRANPSKVITSSIEVVAGVRWTPETRQLVKVEPCP
jgi:hypothetical protein